MYIFILQSSSIDFLASQGFDFNKVFKVLVLFKENVQILTQQTLTKHNRKWK